MKHVSTCKDSLCTRLELIVYVRTGGHAVHRNACTLSQLVLRKQTYGQKQSITAVKLLGSRDRLAVCIYLCKSDSGYTLFALDVHNGVAELQRNIVVVQALNDVSL